MSTEDTTAQLREQISSALSYTSAGADCFALADQIMPIVLAQVEAAKATARRDALGDAAYELLAEPDMNAHETASWLLARASAQGVAPPAEAMIDVTEHGIRPENSGEENSRNMQRLLDAQQPGHWPQRSGGQGAQSSGPSSVANDWCVPCMAWHPKGIDCPDQMGAQSSGHAEQGTDVPRSAQEETAGHSGEQAQSSGHEYQFVPPPGSTHANLFCTYGWGGPGYCGRSAEWSGHVQRGPVQPGEQDTADD